MDIDIFNTDKKYNIIYADPPWSYQNWCDKKNGAAKAHYETMTQADIEALPVGKIAADDSILFMWATFPKLQEALNTIKAWGFEYKTIGFCWVKRNKNGTWFKGIGFYTKSNCEVCLIATKGKPPKASIHHNISQIIETVREVHSKKPDIVKDKIVEFSGDLPRIELFARKQTEGWDVWGNETHKFSSTTRRKRRIRGGESVNEYVLYMFPLSWD